MNQPTFPRWASPPCFTQGLSSPRGLREVEGQDRTKSDGIEHGDRFSLPLLHCVRPLPSPGQQQAGQRAAHISTSIAWRKPAGLGGGHEPCCRCTGGGEEADGRSGRPRRGRAGDAGGIAPVPPDRWPEWVSEFAPSVPAAASFAIEPRNRTIGICRANLLYSRTIKGGIRRAILLPARVEMGGAGRGGFPFDRWRPSIGRPLPHGRCRGATSRTPELGVRSTHGDIR
jgi:hypothetical protein